MTTPHAPDSGGYEKSDLRTRPIVWFAVILTIAIILSFLAAYGLYRGFSWLEADRFQTPASPRAAQSGPPEPRLQVAAPQELATLRAAEEAILTGYGWTDREAGLARVPIARAMQLVLERGLPVPPQPAATARAPKKAGAR
jgi:hypothetical protein